MMLTILFHRLLFNSVLLSVLFRNAETIRKTDSMLIPHYMRFAQKLFHMGINLIY